ncbi:MAG: flippase-like domain-containing protein [Thermodesulfobacteria bacterium]|nr:flippase-like domain-containing protein [Thermodesulfobacteriota bacterium]
MKKTGYILFGLGLSLLIGILIYFGIGDIFKALEAAGYGLFLVAASHAAPLLFDAVAWRLLFIIPEPPSLPLLIKARWVGESINSLLPAAQIGGDLVRARMLAVRGYPVADAGASVLVEITIALITQLIFSLVGIAGLVYLGNQHLIKQAVIAVAALSLGAIGFLAVQKKGLWTRLLGIMSVIFSKERLAGLAPDAKALDEKILELYSHRWIIFQSCIWRLAGWFSGAIEVWLALKFLGANTGVFEAILLESLGQVIRGIAFLVPGAFGVQEGGFVILGNLLGITPEIALGMSLAKRFRELILGIPGLIVWQVEEGKLVFSSKKKKETRKGEEK